MNVPVHLARFRVGAAERNEFAGRRNPIFWRGETHAIGADAVPRGRVDSAVLHEFFAGRASVAVAFGIEGEMSRENVPSFRLDLSITGMNGLIAL